MDDDLANRVQSLSQELYDKIYDQVFTPHKRRRIIVDSSYKPPLFLCIDRTTRERFNVSYYSQNIFSIELEVDNGKYHSGRWVKSLPREHRALLVELGIDFDRTHDDGDGWVEELKDLIEEYRTYNPELDIGYEIGYAKLALMETLEGDGVKVEKLGIELHVDGKLVVL